MFCGAGYLVNCLCLLYTSKSYYGGCESINYCPGVSKAPGEVKPKVWVYCKIAEGLGLDPRCMFSYYTTDENWEADWDRYLRDCYQGAIDYYQERGKQVPDWEDFKKGRFINCDELVDEPHTGWDKQIKEGKPFRTESGKIEIYSNYVANRENKKHGVHYDKQGQLYDNLPTDWGDFTPYPAWLAANRDFEDANFPQYPLVLLASVCRYRVHSLFWEQPWLRDQVYRHRIWVNVHDAAVRGIKDDDLVEAYNDRGRVVMPAYVTARIMPGMILIRHGAAYTPGKDGIDFGASPSTLLGGDTKSMVVPAQASNRVQIRKYEGGRA